MTLELPPMLLACPRCATQIAPGVLACPGCGTLVHADRLSALAAQARAATDAGDTAGALQAWREALDLLPSQSKQHNAIRQRITDLGRVLDGRGPAPAAKAAEGDAQKSAFAKAAGGLGAAGLLLLKFKTLVLIVLTKFKFLLWGLTKASTLFSMLLSLGVYWAMWGWKFALGIVLSIYIHEMGHVIALWRYGFKATSPMFIPGLGAFIRLQQQVVNPSEDAAIGLAGPIYGLGAALASAGLFYATHLPIFAAIAGVGAWINLFNLLPIGTLDGGRGFHALSRVQKWVATLIVLGAWYGTGDGLLALVGIVCAGRALTDKSNGPGDAKAAFQYGGLVIALSLITLLRTYAHQ